MRLLPGVWFAGLTGCRFASWGSSRIFVGRRHPVRAGRPSTYRELPRRGFKEIFERSTKRRVHSGGGILCLSARSNALRGTPPPTHDSTILSRRRHRASLHGDPDLFRPVGAAILPHAPHHRRLAPSHIASTDLGR